MTRTNREVELKSLSWQEIKAIAGTHGITKPEDGWENAIPLVLAVEFPEGNEPEPEPEDEVGGTHYCSSFFEASGVPFCQGCGDSFHNDFQGNPICPIDSSECPRLK